MASPTDTQDSIRSDSDEGDNPIVVALARAYAMIRGSFLVFTIVVGFVTAVLGATPFFDGAEAGLMGLVGVSLVLYGIIGFGVLRLIGYSG